MLIFIWISFHAYFEYKATTVCIDMVVLHESHGDINILQSQQPAEAQTMSLEQ